MADNVTSNSGAGGGAVFATDDIGGVHYPITKITIGALDASTLLTGGSGTVDAGCPRVTLATNDAAVTALQLIDNAVSGAGFNITQFGGASVPIGAGLEATAVRVTLPTDGTGKVSAAQSGTWDIGTVTTVTTCATVTNLSQLGGQAIAMGTGARSAGTLRVTVATDDVVPVTGTFWQATQPVSGTVTANLGTIAGVSTESTLSTLNGKVTACNTGAVVISSGTITTLTGTTSLTPGTAATNLGKAEDAAHTSGDVGVMALAVRVDTAAAQAGTTGDYAPLQVSAIGALRVELTDEAGAELDFRTEGENWNAADHGILIFGRDQDSTPDKYRAVNLDASGNVKVLSSTGAGLALETGGNLAGAATSLAIIDDWDSAASDACSVAGDVAHDTADAGEPVKIGAKAETSPKASTLVADGDRTNLYADVDGLQLVKLNTSGADCISEAVSNTDGASTAFTNFSAVVGTKNYITAYHCFRTDSGTTPIFIDFRDGTAGSVLWRVVLPAGGGANSPACAGPALFKTAANTALAFDVSAATSTVYINVSGYQSKV